MFVKADRTRSATDKTGGDEFRWGEDMTVVPSAIGLVAADLPQTLPFYRALGLDIPLDADSGAARRGDVDRWVRILFDPESTIKSFDPAWTAAPAGSPHYGAGLRVHRSRRGRRHICRR